MPQFDVFSNRDERDANKNESSLMTGNDQKLDDWGKAWKYMNENQLKCYSKMGLVPECGKKEYINWYNMFIDFLNDKNITGISEDVASQFLDYLKDKKEKNIN